MRFGFAIVFLAWFSVQLAVPAEASRAELDGRGLPRLLAVDPANLILFPGSAAQFGRTALVDYSEYQSNTLNYIDYYYLRSLPPMVSPVTSGSERFAMALTGKHLAFGYVLDGATHNLVLSHESGWGASFGISDVYDAVERSERRFFGNSFNIRDSQDEISRRDLRLTLGWAGTKDSGRVYEIALGGDLVSAQQSTYRRLATEDTTVVTSSEWTSEPGFGFDLRLRTVSPQPGFQAVLRYAYENLESDVDTGEPSSWIRRYALAELGWRLPLQVLDDIVTGVVLEFSHDTFTNIFGTSSYAGDWEDAQNKRYFGQIFASGQHKITGRWIGRAGVKGSAYFQEETIVRNNTELGSSSSDYYKRSRGAILNPEFFLGVGWSWKQFTLDGRLRESISLTNPVSQWSVSYSW